MFDMLSEYWWVPVVLVYVGFLIAGILVIVYIGMPMIEQYHSYCKSLANNLTKIKDQKLFELEHDKYYPICILAR